MLPTVLTHELMKEENEPDTLRYLVVDELHTFDGAQGTDPACLIRRVKARVKTPRDHIGNQAAEDLEILYFEPPGPEHREALSPSKYDSIETFTAAQAELWFGESMNLATSRDRFQLAGQLRRHNFLRTFLGYFRNGVLEEEVILADLKKRYGSWEAEHHRLLINSFISLCAVARDAPRENAYFLQIRAELWMRELARMVASVSPRPVLRFSMDLPADHPQKHLAAIHCRDCGVMGWGGVQKANEDRIIPELDRFYTAAHQVLKF